MARVPMPGDPPPTVDVARIPLDTSLRAVLAPGTALDFFPWGGDLPEAALCAELARLAYVPDAATAAPFLARAGLELLDWRDDAQAFAARGRGLTAIVFRGTDSAVDLIRDLAFLPEHWALGGYVHRGFAAALRPLGPWALAAAAQATGRLVLAGHSFGGALAILFASVRAPDHLYTFGAPRVGDRGFAERQRAVAHDRFVGCADVVCRMPSARLGGSRRFAHSGTRRFIDRAGTLRDGWSDEEIAADCRAARAEYPVSLVRAVVEARAPWRGLADHAPINYLSAVAGRRA